MTYFIKNGNQFRTTAEANINIQKELPVGTYSIGMDMSGFFLEVIDDLKVEGKIYGNADKRADRIINTFGDRPNSTGIILEGEKGSGKTFLAKILSQKLLGLEVPTLIVNSAFAGDPFNQLIQSINQPCMIFFDEFEKVYKPETQSMLLTLLDGTFASKKLFVLALNDTYRLVDFFKNRPGRFFYRFDYKGLEEDFIREYCGDNLKNKKHIDAVVLFASTFASFNFDILKALVEEMNRYDEGIAEVTKYLNAAPVSIQAKYQVVDFELKKPKTRGKHTPVFKETEKMVNHGQMLNPLISGVYVSWMSKDDYEYNTHFHTEDLMKIEQRNMTFENDEGRVTIAPYQKKKLDLMETMFSEDWNHPTATIGQFDGGGFA